MSWTWFFHDIYYQIVFLLISSTSTKLVSNWYPQKYFFLEKEKLEFWYLCWVTWVASCITKGLWIGWHKSIFSDSWFLHLGSSAYGLFLNPTAVLYIAALLFLNYLSLFGAEWSSMFFSTLLIRTHVVCLQLGWQIWFMLNPTGPSWEDCKAV